jgi:hypothetical protein
MANIGDQPCLCPYCGETPRRILPTSRIRRVRASATAPDELGGVGGGVDVEMNPSSNAEAYYDCGGCNNQYVDISKRDIDAVLRGMSVSAQVVDEIRNNYGKIELSTLIRDHRSGITRKPRHIGSFFSKQQAKRKIMVCIDRHGTRVYISCIKKRELNGTEHYHAERVGIP